MSLTPTSRFTQRTPRGRRGWPRARPRGRAAARRAAGPRTRSTNDVTKATDATTVTSVPPDATPSHDFFGLTLGASGRWNQPPPETDPIRKAAVSNRNVSTMIAEDERVAVGQLQGGDQVSAEQRDPRHVEHREPDVRARRPCDARRGTVMNHRKVGDHAEREHRRRRRLAAEVGAEPSSAHRRPARPAVAGWCVVLHHHPEQLALRDEHARCRRTTAKAAGPAHSATTATPARTRPVRNAAGHVAFADLRPATVDLRADLDRRRLLPAGPADALAAHDDGPRGVAGSWRSESRSCFDLVGGTEIARARVAAALASAGEHVDRLGRVGVVTADRAGEVLRGGLELLVGGGAHDDPLVVGVGGSSHTERTPCVASPAGSAIGSSATAPRRSSTSPRVSTSGRPARPRSRRSARAARCRTTRPRRSGVPSDRVGSAASRLGVLLGRRGGACSVRTSTCSSAGVTVGRLLGLVPVDVADRREELVEVFEELVAVAFSSAIGLDLHQFLLLVTLDLVDLGHEPVGQLLQLLLRPDPRSSSEMAPSRSSFSISSFAWRRTLRTATRASSARWWTCFTSSGVVPR